jgi:hypothetical protein
MDAAVLVRLVNGQPKSVTKLPAFIGLYGIACPSSTTCYAVGYDNSGDAGATTTITNGHASAPGRGPERREHPLAERDLLPYRDPVLRGWPRQLRSRDRSDHIGDPRYRGQRG